MRLGIDASNLRTGGAVTHLVEVLRAADPLAYGFTRVMVWGGRGTLHRIEDREWLVKSSVPLLDRRLPYRVFWQRTMLARAARRQSCDLLFVPGGSHGGDFRPVVTMSRNLLPFEWPELRRYGSSLVGLRLRLLRRAQSRTFRRADGLIFLTQYARETVTRVIGSVPARTTVIPHGVDARFSRRPREQRPVDHYSPERPFRVLYVSIIDLYKHQWHVAEAIAQLRRSGLPIELELVGPAYAPALARLNETLNRVDPLGEFVCYSGSVPHEKLHDRYAEADLCLFASSCENMPNILLEGMASGLPIACSNRGAMPEVLGEAGAYFDPESPDDIARALRELLLSPTLRARFAQASFERSRAYSWRNCAAQTFQFLREAVTAQAVAALAVETV
jgi:glycosyltransferase involved in cell wall biosynthesis